MTVHSNTILKINECYNTFSRYVYFLTLLSLPGFLHNYQYIVLEILADLVQSRF